MYRVISLAAAALILAVACGSNAVEPTVDPKPPGLRPCHELPATTGGSQGDDTVGLHRYCLQLELDRSVDRTQIIQVLVLANQAAEPLRNRIALVYHPGGPGLSAVSTMLQDPPNVDLDTYVLLTWDGTTSGNGPGACGPESISYLTERTRDNFVAGAKATAEECLGGFGGPGDIGAWAAADELEAIRAALGLDRVDLLTFSYGTAIAEAYLHVHPDRVRRAVLDAPVALDVPWPSRLRLAGTTLRDEADRLARSCATDACESVLADTGSGGAYAAIRAAVLQRDPKVGSGSLTLTPVMFDQAAELALRSEANWEGFATGVDQALKGDGSSLWRVAERLYLDLDRSVFYQSLCADIDRPQDPAAYVLDTGPIEFAFGSELAPCAGFPRGVIRPTQAGSSIAAPDVLVVASDRDILAPASLARNAPFLQSIGALCETQVPGHTSYGDPAVRELILEFLRSGDAQAIAGRCSR